MTSSNNSHDWVGKMNSRKLCKKFRCDHTNSWYMHNPKSILKNKMDEVLWDFEIQNIILSRLDLVIGNKKKKKRKRKVDFG